VTGRASDHSIPQRSEEAVRPVEAQFRVLAPTFVELSEDQAERAVRALAGLLAAAAERERGTSS